VRHSLAHGRDLPDEFISSVVDQIVLPLVTSAVTLPAGPGPAARR
jgi:hypothetical protein